MSQRSRRAATYSAPSERRHEGRQATHHWQPDALRSGRPRAAPQTPGPAHLRQRRIVERRLRHPGDPAGAGVRRHGLPLPDALGRYCRHRADDRRGRVLPAARPRLPDRRRRLRGGEQEHRHAGGRRRRERVARRLRDDGRGVGVLRRRQHHLRLPVVTRISGVAGDRFRRTARRGEPARPSRGWHRVRGADLPVRRRGLHHDRHRPDPGRRRSALRSPRARIT